jgi:O-Antigen ligase
MVAELIAMLAASSTLGILATRDWQSAILTAAAPVALWLSRVRPGWLIWAVFLEVMLGGWGHLLSIGSLPIRHALLTATLAAWLFNKLLDGDWQLRGGRFAWAVAIFLAFVMVTVLVSLALGHPHALQDGLTPAFLLMLFPLCDIAARPGGARWLLRVFLIPVLLLAVVQILLTMGIFVGLLDGHRLAAVFHERIGGVVQITGSYWRVFIVGSIFFQVAILMLVAVRLAGDTILGRIVDLLALSLIVCALLFTYTRGYWLTAIIGLLVLALVTTPRGRIKWVAGGLVAVLASIVLLLAADVSVVDVFVQRFLLLFNPDRDISVALRVDLYPRLIARIAERPLFGYGFGLPVENQLYYENSYLYYLIKFGFVGLAVMAWGWILVLIEGVRLSRARLERWPRAIAAGVVAATVSMLAVAHVNPFINSALGLYFLAWSAAVLYGLRSSATRPGNPA